MKEERHFKEAKINLKCSCSYQGANHTDKLFAKDECGNVIENWEFYISNQKDKDTDSIWFTLVSKDKDDNHITQIDFNDISKDDLSDLIKDLASLYKAML